MRDSETAWEASKTASIDIGLVFIGNYYVQALVACGRYAEAEAVVRYVDSRSARKMHVIDADGRMALLWARGHVDDVLELVDACRRSGETYAIEHTTFCDWRGYLVRCLHLQERDREAGRVAAQGLALARAWSTPRSIGMALRTAAVAETGTPQIDLLKESVTVLGDSSAKFELALSHFALGEALRRAKRVQEARLHSQEALDLAELCAAAPLKEKAKASLRMLGVRPITTVKTGAATLTPGEVRVAGLAMQGLSNREIAQTLFVSVKAVEIHLSNAFRKLGVKRRTELARVLSADGQLPGVEP